jgi:autoinducer 2-degrading protein
MLVVVVNVHVLKDGIDAFREATLKNARASLKEPGIARFDVLQEKDDAARFVLIEGYLDAGAPAAHKQTAHYLAWRDSVAPLMASPRVSQQYDELLP